MPTIVLGVAAAAVGTVLLLLRFGGRFGLPSDAARPTGLLAAQPEADSQWLARVLRKKIVAHLKNDQSIEGVLMEQTEDGVILRASVLLGEDGKRTPMAGETFVPRENVAFAQLDE